MALRHWQQHLPERARRTAAVLFHVIMIDAVARRHGDPALLIGTF
jgi:hypothetical protein